jgi:hypothetical protein
MKYPKAVGITPQPFFMPSGKASLTTFEGRLARTITDLTARPSAATKIYCHRDHRGHRENKYKILI